LLRLPVEQRSSVNDLLALRVAGVPLGELVKVEEALADKSIYHKNLMPVVYVTGDVAGAEESPVYAILKLNEKIKQLPAVTLSAAKGLSRAEETAEILPLRGSGLRQNAQNEKNGGMEILTTRQPFSTEELAMKWDGEWHITFEVFRDLGVAFAMVLILIYVLVVGWFRSFKTPFIIMAAIPFSLVGILPAHWAMGAFFTATSMIGFIAGAGIVVRNSIILVDFIELRLSEGMPLAEAVIDAGAVRFRPMMLTAAAVVVGASVILFDPIFQGLAIALMAGEIASLLLSRMAVPVIYYLIESK
jgi:multidrug efflux pump subunit AcrB